MTYYAPNVVSYGFGAAPAKAIGAFSIYLARFPAHRFSVSVLCNGGAPARDLAHRIVDIYLRGNLGALSAIASSPPATERAFVVDTGTLRRHTGTFLSEARATVRWVRLVGDTLYLMRSPTSERDSAGRIDALSVTSGNRARAMRFGREVR